MSKVQHYKNLNSNLDKIYNIIKDTINQEHNLKIVSEYKGFLNSVPLRSIVAINNSPKVIVGALREIHVSITDEPNDYAIDVAFRILVWKLVNSRCCRIGYWWAHRSCCRRYSRSNNGIEFRKNMEKNN